jgi:hypothetical protein
VKRILVVVALMTVTIGVGVGAQPAGAAVASPSEGCGYLNNGGFDARYTSASTGGQFAAGEQMTMVATDPEEGGTSASLSVGTSVLAVVDAEVGFPATLTYTIPADAELSVHWKVEGADSAGWQVSCTAAQARSAGCDYLQNMPAFDSSYISTQLGFTEFAAGEQLTMVASNPTPGAPSVALSVAPPPEPAVFTVVDTKSVFPATLTYTIPADGRLGIRWGFPTSLSYSAAWQVSCTPAPLPTDSTAPTVTCDGPAPVFLLNQSPAAVSASVVDEDGGSGAATATVTAAADTSTVGNKSVSLTGADNEGNTSAAVSCPYQVVYGFTGFAAPVDNGGVLNTVKAGQAVPLKFRLTDANGAPVTTRPGASLKATSLECGLGTTDDALEEYSKGKSGLQSLGNGYYQYNWATPKSYAGSCKTANLNLGEGKPRQALFKFTK